MDYCVKTLKRKLPKQGPVVGITELFNACSHGATLVRSMIITLLWTDSDQQSTASQYDFISAE